MRRRSRSAPVTAVEPDATIPDPARGPEDLALDGARRELVHRLRDVLPPRQREILVLRIVVGLSAEETAEAVGSTPGPYGWPSTGRWPASAPLAPVEEDEHSDWLSAPLTGDPELDRLLGDADAALRRLGEG